MKLVAIVVTYYPEVDETLRNCMAYIQHVDKLIVWENTPEPDRSKYRITFDRKYADKVLYMGDGTNHCIAYPLNRAVEWGWQNGYTHLLTMDQDSLFEAGHFEIYKNNIESFLVGKAGVFGANPNHTYAGGKEPLEVLWTITSGTIYSLSMLRTIGLFREDYEIDALDYEMTYRAGKNGFGVFVFPGIILRQEFGHTQEYRFFSTDGYSPFRIYHIIRNHIALWKEYPSFFHGKKSLIGHYIFKRTLTVMLAEDQKRKRLKAIFYGIKDGLTGRLKPRHL